MDRETDTFLAEFFFHQGKKLDELKTLFQKAITFIDDYKAVKQKGDTVEKERLSKLAGKLKEQLIDEANRVALSSQMSKEQLEAFSNNSENFTKEQWEFLEMVRQLVKDKGKGEGVTKSSSKGSETAVTKKGRLKRQHWIKS